MAQAFRWVCAGCGRAVVAWSDGNPYYLDEAGGKQYAYHPNHERLARCIGNDEPHLCLGCGNEWMVDSRRPVTTSPACGADASGVLTALVGQPCPYCRAGRFAADSDFRCVS